MLLWQQFLIICPLVFLSGFVDAIAGGGGLISLPAYMLAGVPVHQAIGSNKLSSSIGSTVSTVRYAKQGFVDWKMAGPCIVCAFAGSFIGSNLSLLLDEQYFKVLMLCLLPFIAYYVLKTKNLDRPTEEFSLGKTMVISMAVALFVGMYDGFYGPGAGTFMLLLLTGAAHLRLQQAAGMTKVINLTTNIASLLVFLTTGNVILPLGLVAGVFGMAGHYVGATRFTKGGSKTVRPIMLCVLALFFVKVIMELLGI